MSSDLLTCHLKRSTAPQPRADHSLVPLDPRWRDQLALAYLNAYPPGVAAKNLDVALQEIDDTFAGEYGKLRNDASWVAIQDGGAVGAVHVVERSIWDPELPGPFIIDLFVAPASTGRGLGRSLIRAAVAACSQEGDTQLSLRIGDGTSAAAAHLYADHGFMPLTQAR
ncbi:MAG: GNAT family N-acetyltransferase [Galactobacter sp.]